MLGEPSPRKTSPARDDELSPGAGLYALLHWMLAIGLVWLVVLPWLAHRPHIDARLRWLDENQVDPSAMYYTEVEALKPVLKRLNDRLRNGGTGKPPWRDRASPVR